MGEFCDSLLLLELELHGLEGGGGLHGPGPVNLRDLHHGGRGGGSLNKILYSNHRLHTATLCASKRVFRTLLEAHIVAVLWERFFFFVL